MSIVEYKIQSNVLNKMHEFLKLFNCDNSAVYEVHDFIQDPEDDEHETEFIMIEEG